MKSLIAFLVVFVLTAGAVTAQEPTLDKATKSQLCAWLMGYSQSQTDRVIATYPNVLVRVDSDTIFVDHVEGYDEMVDGKMVRKNRTVSIPDKITNTPIYRAADMREVVADLDKYLASRVVLREQKVVNDSLMATARKVKF